MNPTCRQQLASLLNRWADQQAASEAQLKSLRERIVQTAEQKPAVKVSIAEQTGCCSHPPLSEKQKRTLWILCGISVVILAILGYVSRLGPPAKKKPAAIVQQAILVEENAAPFAGNNVIGR